MYLNDIIISKNNVRDVLNNRVIAISAITKYPSYLLSGKATLLYSIGLLDLEVYTLNLRR